MKHTLVFVLGLGLGGMTLAGAGGCIDPYYDDECWPDEDGDGFPASDPCGYWGDDETLDCEDDKPAINPGADDPAGDGLDQNCDGVDG